MYAVTTHTPSEMVVSRANADHENMGLRAWKGDHVTQADVDISKNTSLKANSESSIVSL